MTSLTGKTEMTLESTVKVVPYPVALLGAVVQLTTVTYVWGTYTSAKDCMSAPLDCLANLQAADIFGRQVVLTFASAAIQWIASVVFGLQAGTLSDPSLVDRLWSILPWVYVWHFYFSAPSDRLLIMAVLSTTWGCRLTWNFWRKGGFSGGEDYRWAVIKGWYPGWKFELFNLIFISFFQQLLLLAFVTPAAAAVASDAPLNWLDYTAAALYALLILGEHIADMQMFAFQTEKYRRKNAGEPLGEYSNGFIESGLWGLSRHPNYFCEVSMWWVFYLFSIAATGEPLNWTILGAVFLSLLFVPPGASLDTTEMLSSAKYPKYRDYQQRVSRFIPWFPAKKKGE